MKKRLFTLFSSLLILLTVFNFTGCKHDVEPEPVPEETPSDKDKPS